MKFPGSTASEKQSCTSDAHSACSFYPLTTTRCPLRQAASRQRRHNFSGGQSGSLSRPRGDIEVPLWEWQLPDERIVAVHDLMRDTKFVWSGKSQRIRLDPAELPFAIWRVARDPEAR